MHAEPPQDIERKTHPEAISMPVGVAIRQLGALLEAALAGPRHVIVLILRCFPYCPQLCIGSRAAAVPIHCVSGGQEALRCPDQKLPAVLAIPAGRTVEIMQ